MKTLIGREYPANIQWNVDMIIQYLQRLIIMGVLFKRLFKICIIKNYWIQFSYDIINYQTLSLCYLLQPSALADNSDLGINNSLYHAQPHQLIA